MGGFRRRQASARLHLHLTKLLAISSERPQRKARAGRGAQSGKADRKADQQRYTGQERPGQSRSTIGVQPMAYDYTEAPPQREIELIPHGTVATVSLKNRAGG